MVELDLPAGLGIEANALYRRVHLTSSQLTSSESLWDFPLLVKYKFPGVLARPYIAGGWTYRNLGDQLSFSSSNGFVLSSGVRIGLVLIKISPEFRFTRWDDSPSDPGFRTNRNQAEILVGVTF